MIVVIGGIKGGSGKTTLATNLTILRSCHCDVLYSGKNVLLVDADEQRSSSDWAEQRQSHAITSDFTTIQLAGKSVGLEVKKLASNYSDVIVDVGGRDTTSQRSALLVADVFLIPFKPRSLDVWTLGPVKSMIKEIKECNQKLICLAVINMADANGSDNEDSMEILRECLDIQVLPFTIGHRKAYGNAATKGSGVIEGRIPDKKAMKEIVQLNDYIFKECLTHTG